ncbi:hypothetical protein [Cognatishimia activa]|nr:hypothetical protein [Cognatishimia activa]
MSGGPMTQYIHRDIEIECAGPAQRVLSGWTARALRQIADKLERDEFQDGHHDVTDRHGKKLGSVYFDFSEGHQYDDNES